jgi:adenosylcobinamide-phosphate synthase
LLVYAGSCIADAMLRLPNALHPVAWFGRATGFVLRLAPLTGPARAFVAGALIAFGLPLVSVALVHETLSWSARWSVAHALLQGFVLYACFSLFGLLAAARTLALTLAEQGTEAARPRLGWLCSRDSSALDASGLANGTIESLAENLSDSVIAPLFFLLCFGIEGAVAYRAINTLDAMIGYRDRYEWLGKTAARIDDLANLVPARLTVLLLMAAGASLGTNQGVSLRRGLAVWWRDRAQTASPNAGHPMAMAAGLLGVRLDKPGHYALGPALPAPEPEDIRRAIVLCRRAGLLSLAAAGAGVYVLGLDGALR